MLMETIIEAASDKKAEEIMSVPVPSHLGIADAFVLCTVFTPPHMRAVVDNITDRVQEALGRAPGHIEGDFTSDWVLMDYGDVVVHVMNPTARAFYDLEKLWAAYAGSKAGSKDAPAAEESPEKSVTEGE